MEWDHPDIYKTAEAYQQAFVDFLKLVPAQGTIILCGDDPGVQTLLPMFPNALTYGLDGENSWRAVNPTSNNEGGFRFELEIDHQRPLAEPISLKVPGLHNVNNSLAALAMSSSVGVPLAEAAEIIATYTGTERRFDLKGIINEITVIDDYAHHPTEIAVNLAAAKARFGGQSIWAVFQPHTFSRTKLLLTEFAAALNKADHVILLDIYPSREKDDGSVHSTDILQRMAHHDARHIAAIPDAAAYLQDKLSPGDVLITFGAGDGYKVGELVLQALQHKSAIRT
jgi:UDP-N-acetylmuramate--alanine ligase